MSGQPTRAKCAVALLGAATAVLVLGGCRADDRAAAPAGSPSVSATGAVSAGADSTGAVSAGPAPAVAPDPLAGVDAVVGAAERDLDADVGVASR